MSIRLLVRICVCPFGVVLFLSFVGQAQARSVPQPMSVGGGHSQTVLHLLSTVTIPGTPASQWCYDTAVVDDGTYYLADNDRAGIDLIHDGEHPSYQSIIGKGQFTGIGGCKSGNYDTDGPNGLVIANDQIFAGDGNSSVRVYDKETGKLVKTISTQGHLRSDEMTYDSRDQLVIVANGSERDYSKKDAPFLSFISTKKGKTYDQIVKTLKFPHADALEQPMWNPSDGKLYLAVPSSDQNTSGEVDVIDLATLRVTSIPTPNCKTQDLLSPMETWPQSVVLLATKSCSTCIRTN